MGFLTDLFSSGGTESGPAPRTEQQIALQDQAVDVGNLQLGNIQSQTDFQQDLFAQIMASMQRRQGVDRSLFGGPAPQGPSRRDEFLTKQKTDLAAFKESLGRSNLFGR